jgi:hypothetical protein
MRGGSSWRARRGAFATRLSFGGGRRRGCAGSRCRDAGRRRPVQRVVVIDVQRAGPVRPWPARAGPGQPAAGRYGLRATRVGPPTDTGRDLGPWPGPWVI